MAGAEVLLHLYKTGQWLTLPVIMKKPWWLVIWTLEPWNMFVHYIHSLGGGRKVKAARIFPLGRLLLPITSAADVHLKPWGELLCDFSLPAAAPLLGRNLLYTRAPSLWSLLSAASGTKNLLFANSSVHLGWRGGQRVVPAFLPPCSAEALLELIPEAALCLLQNINICGVFTGVWPHTCT